MSKRKQRETQIIIAVKQMEAGRSGARGGPPMEGTTRRGFLKGSAATLTALPALARGAADMQEGSAGPIGENPNVIIFHSDQFRWDALGAYASPRTRRMRQTQRVGLLWGMPNRNHQSGLVSVETIAGNGGLE